MISSVADILLKLKGEEEKKINEFRAKYPNTPHSTIIGDMYEGLTKNILEKVIFRGLDLRVTSGQITNKNGDFSHEVDCMIVEGEGDPIPNTNKHIYDISKVIAVIEVKKNLNKDDLFDSYFKMVKLSDMFDPRDMSENEFRLFRDAFRSATGMEVPEHKNIINYSLEIEMIYHTLLIEALMPLRIVFGFYGYKSMNSLRGGFTKLLQENVSTEDKLNKGFSPGSFPDLIFTGNSSLVKANGMPYTSTIGDDGFWDVYVSSSHNPLLHFLELLWTRLSYKHGISSDLFGDELIMEGFFRYLGAKPQTVKELIMWEFRYVELPKKMDTTPFFYSWEPQELTDQEYLLITLLCNGEEINTKSDIFLDILEKDETDEFTFINRLNKKKLIYKDEKNDVFLLTDECSTVIKNGKFYAGENRDGRMMKWVLNN